MIKKSKYGNSLKKNNLKLLLNQNENIYSKKIKNYILKFLCLI